MRLGFFLAKPLDFLNLCMGEDIHKINTNLILLTGPVNFLLIFTHSRKRRRNFLFDFYVCVSVIEKKKFGRHICSVLLPFKGFIFFGSDKKKAGSSVGIF
jgi:hypothetical protein